MFADAGVDADVRIVEGNEVAPAARRAGAEGFAAVVAGGGDCTVSAAAGALAGTQLPLGVLPLGTLNHFAKDLGIPLELPHAARLIADAVRGGPHSPLVRAIDVGEVNGRVFVNNSSIGLYPRIVRHRDRQMERLGRGKWLAMLTAALGVLRRFPTVRVRLAVSSDAANPDENRQTYVRTTPFVFVGNNRYEFDLFNFGRRTAIDRGELEVYFGHRTGRFGLLVLALRALVGRLDQAKDFEVMCVHELFIDTGKSRLRVAMDGEITELQPPLHYRTRPGALRVIVPAGARPALSR
jgi:diacylglycerol kinase family enzyme